MLDFHSGTGRRECDRHLFDNPRRAFQLTDLQRAVFYHWSAIGAIVRVVGARIDLRRVPEPVPAIGEPGIAALRLPARFGDDMKCIWAAQQPVADDARPDRGRDDQLRLGIGETNTVPALKINFCELYIFHGGLIRGKRRDFLHDRPKGKGQATGLFDLNRDRSAFFPVFLPHIA